MNHPLTEKIINEALNEFPTVGFHPDKFLRGLTIEAIKYAIQRTANEFRVEEIKEDSIKVGNSLPLKIRIHKSKIYNQCAKETNAKVDSFNPKTNGQANN